MPDKPKLSEADILFELFLPMLCAERHQALAVFKGKIVLHMTGDAPRSWNVTGGKAPWVQRGALDSPDVEISFAPDIVQGIVRGAEPDIEAALAGGGIEIKGDAKVLKSFQMTMEEAKGIVGTMLNR